MDHNGQYELPFSDEEVMPEEWMNGRPTPDRVYDWLCRQPGSFELWNSIDEQMERIDRGELIPWIYMRHNEEQGLILLRIPKTQGVSLVFLEFLSCENPFAMMRAMRFLEHYLLKCGFEAIMAVAHPTIASAAVKRHGYTNPQQVIYKKLGKHDA